MGPQNWKNGIVTEIAVENRSELDEPAGIRNKKGPASRTFQIYNTDVVMHLTSGSRYPDLLRLKYRQPVSVIILQGYNRNGLWSDCGAHQTGCGC
jgi:hypothetical protein